jgi:hypothetical protein
MLTAALILSARSAGRIHELSPVIADDRFRIILLMIPVWDGPMLAAISFPILSWAMSQNCQPEVVHSSIKELSPNLPDSGSSNEKQSSRFPYRGAKTKLER